MFEKLYSSARLYTKYSIVFIRVIVPHGSAHELWSRCCWGCCFYYICNNLNISPWRLFVVCIPPPLSIVSSTSLFIAIRSTVFFHFFSSAEVQFAWSYEIFSRTFSRYFLLFSLSKLYNNEMMHIILFHVIANVCECRPCNICDQFKNTSTLECLRQMKSNREVYIHERLLFILFQFHYEFIPEQNVVTLIILCAIPRVHDAPWKWYNQNLRQYCDTIIIENWTVEKDASNNHQKKSL